RMTVGPATDEELDRIIAAGGRKGEIYAQLRELRDRVADRVRAEFPDIPRRVSGYNLPALLPEHGFNVARSVVGSEGTCVVVLAATLRLIDSPPARTLLVLGYPDVYAAGDHVPEIMRFGPIALEGIDDRLVDDMTMVHMHGGDLKYLPDGQGWLLVEFGGATKEEADARARRAMEALQRQNDAPSMKLYDDKKQEKHLWEIRESGLGATAHVPNKKITWEGWEDSSVPPENLGVYLRKLRALFEKYGYECDLYGHFGQGCVHTRIDFDLETAPGIAKFREFLHEAAHLVVSLGGSISGEHGDGQSKAELLPIMFGDELMSVFREFKAIWDPDWRMNPGKIVKAYRTDENLRLGVAYDPAEPATHFHYRSDSGSFNRAMLRCVGVGKCRKHEGTMCPSYQVTREEMHATHGRARLLSEMIHGGPLKDGWKSEAVKEALDLCLMCKGCKGECPVRVDMATYKAEFLSHYYAGRRRPVPAYAFGLIDRWARIAAYAPGLLNGVLQGAPVSALAKSVVDMPRQRSLPRFAPQTFRTWFRRRRSAQAGGQRVLLWPDTFNNHFHPESAIAAVDVLEAAGCNVAVPAGHVCCGRPLYEWGMLDRAKRYLRRALDALDADIRAGTPVIVLEPACASVFRNEMLELFPSDEQAKRLAGQTFLLSEFLARHAPSYTPPKLPGKAIVHGHCHHKSVLGMGDEVDVLRGLGLDLDVLDSGCCGMAGTFGFEAHKYEVSIAAGERVLLPAVRGASPDTLIIADGYSCREQIAQTTTRRAMHLAEVMQRALRGAEEGR
ncbi:MAG TPA: FAD-linked oxidase C-terminal domain-containing protein, partial [Casimicrobiaceae bacterium]|nr:FAD-linked oxidase C-terminal domain-containing protein [Casimicrobiaceae bacterium]